MLAIAALAALLLGQRRSQRNTGRVAASSIAVHRNTPFSGVRARALAARGASKAITGRVRTVRAQPVPGARVCAVSVNYQPIGSPPSPCVTTDSQGAYAFTSVAAGAYFLRATAAGFAPGAANGGKALLIAEDDVQSGIDITLQEGGALIAGTVLDATGGAVPHATVRVARTPQGDLIDVEADDQGRFSASISEGTVAVTAMASGYATARVSTTAPARGLVLTLTPGGTIRGSVTMADNGEPVAGVRMLAVPTGVWGHPSHPSSTSDEDGSFTISGLEPGTFNVVAEGHGLRGQTDEPVQLAVADTASGIHVVLKRVAQLAGRVVIRSTGEACRRGHVALGPAAETDRVPTLRAEITANGDVQFDSVAPGKYRANVLCADHVLAEGPEILDVHGTGSTEALWKVAPGLGLAIQVVDSANAPVPAAQVALEMPAPAGVTRPVMMLTTDANGRHVYPPSLTPGRYTLAPTGGYRGEPVDIELREGMGTVDATLRLQGSGSVLVTVRDKQGEPVDGLSAVAVPASADPAGASGTEGSAGGSPTAQNGRSAVSLGNGKYRIAPLEPGAYQVWIEDHVNPPVSGAANADAVVTVRAGAPAESSIVLERGEALRGKVLDESGGPVPDVWVSATYDTTTNTAASWPVGVGLPGALSASQRVLTDVNGRFSLGGLSRGVRYMVRAEQPFGAGAVQHGVTSETDIVLQLMPEESGSRAATAAQARIIR